MANPLVYSRNTDFTSLVDPPNLPQPGTLQQEILDSACVAVLSYINMNQDLGPPEDWQVEIYFETEPDSADEAVVDAVVAAHEGIPTRASAQSKKSTGESTNSTTTWEDKINATAKPVQAGLYSIGCSCEFNLATGSASADRAACVRVVFDGAEVTESQWPFAGPHDFCFIGTKELVEGETPTLQLQFRRIGVADTAEIRRARVWLQQIEGEEEED